LTIRHFDPLNDRRRAASLRKSSVLVSVPWPARAFRLAQGSMKAATPDCPVGLFGKGARIPPERVLHLTDQAGQR
jgi:hypothetical protein